MSAPYLVMIKLPVLVKGYGSDDAIEEAKKWFDKTYKLTGDVTPVIEYEIINELDLAEKENVPCPNYEVKK
jgi:hypothetical protein